MRKDESGVVALWVVVGLLLLSLAADGYLGWRYSQLHSSNQGLTSEKQDLQNQLNTAKKELDAAKVTNSPTPSTTEAKVTIPQSLIDNIQAALNTMNTAALEGYMAPQVNVVFAASEKQGERTPTQAVSDLSYLQNATQPWDFNLSSSVLSSYGKGSYGKYFGLNVIVGKSTNNYVASFHINSNTKIDTVFVAASESLLQ